MVWHAMKILYILCNFILIHIEYIGIAYAIWFGTETWDLIKEYAAY